MSSNSNISSVKSVRELMKSVSNVDGESSEEVIKNSIYTKPEEFTEDEIRDFIDLKIKNMAINALNVQNFNVEKEVTLKIKLGFKRIELLKLEYFNPVKNMIKWRTCEVYEHVKDHTQLRVVSYGDVNANNVEEEDNVNCTHEIKVPCCKFKTCVEEDTMSETTMKFTWKKSYEMIITKELFDDLKQCYSNRIVKKSLIRYISIPPYSVRLSLYEDSPSYIFIECEDQDIPLRDFLFKISKCLPLAMNPELRCRLMSNILKYNIKKDSKLQTKKSFEIAFNNFELNSADYLMARNICYNIVDSNATNDEDEDEDEDEEEEDDEEGEERLK